MIIGNHQTRQVRIDGALLDPAKSQQLVNHSPDGFCWGYGGSGPAQLSLAICLHLLKDKEKALAVYQSFKWAVIAGLEMDEDFELDVEEMRNVLKTLSGDGLK